MKCDKSEEQEKYLGVIVQLEGMQMDGEFTLLLSQVLGYYRSIANV